MEHHDGSASERGSVLAGISDRIVQLHKELYGKGPTKVKTYYQGDLVVVLLRGGFTRVEHTLIDAGRSASVVDQRREFQEAVRKPFVAAVTEATGREVVSFMSTVDHSTDLLAEVFVLAPGLDGEGSGSEGEGWGSEGEGWGSEGEG
jgi:uncharacterized protein YbcI